MHRGFLTAGAIFGAVAVALGAFGAHGLEDLTSDQKILDTFRTGVQYQMYHALAILAVAFFYDKLIARRVRLSGYSFIAGTILFSGSLYLLALLKIRSSSAANFIGPITPLGGLLLIAGWILLATAVNRK